MDDGAVGDAELAAVARAGDLARVDRLDRAALVRAGGAERLEGAFGRLDDDDPTAVRHDDAAAHGDLGDRDGRRPAGRGRRGVAPGGPATAGREGGAARDQDPRRTGRAEHGPAVHRVAVVHVVSSWSGSLSPVGTTSNQSR